MSKSHNIDVKSWLLKYDRNPSKTMSQLRTLMRLYEGAGEIEKKRQVDTVINVLREMEKEISV